MKHRTFIRHLLPLMAVMALTQCTTPTSRQDAGAITEIPLDKNKASLHVITAEEARMLRTGFLAGKKDLQAKIPGNYLDSTFNMPEGETFNRDAIIALLNAPEATDIRIYLGKDAKGQVRMILLPVDSSGTDILTTLVAGAQALKVPGIPSAKAQSGGQAMESGQRCPPLCKSKI